jgi:hypothetical protein
LWEELSSECVEVVLVGIPAFEKYSDEADAGFNESGCKEQTLTELMPSELVHFGFRFAGEVEGFAGAFGADHAVSLLLELIQSLEQGVLFFEVFETVIDIAEQGMTFFEGVDGEGAIEGDATDSEGLSIAGFFSSGQWAVCGA